MRIFIPSRRIENSQENRMMDPIIPMNFKNISDTGMRNEVPIVLDSWISPMDRLSPMKANLSNLGISVNQMDKLFPTDNTVRTESKVELSGKILFVKIFPISKV